MTRVRQNTRKLHEHDSTVWIPPETSFTDIVAWFLAGEDLPDIPAHLTMDATPESDQFCENAALVTPNETIPGDLAERFDWAAVHTGDGAGADTEDGTLPYDEESFDRVVGLIDNCDLYSRPKPFHETTRIVKQGCDILYLSPKWVPDSDRATLQHLSAIPGLDTDADEDYPDVDYVSQWGVNPGQQGLDAFK